MLPVSRLQRLMAPRQGVEPRSPMTWRLWAPSHEGLQGMSRKPKSVLASLYEQRQRTYILLYLQTWSGLQTNGHELPGVGGIVLDDGPVRHAERLQAASEGLKVVLVSLEHNGVRAGAEAAWGRFSCCVCDLRCEGSSREVGPHYDVVGDGVGGGRGGLTVNRA